MQHEENLSPAELELERTLRSLTPSVAPASVAPDVELAFRLGRASMTRRLRAWQASAAGLGLCILPAFLLAPRSVAPSLSPSPSLGTPSLAESQRGTKPPMRDRDAPALAHADEPPVIVRASSSGYPRLRDAVLARGMDALPLQSGASVSADEIRSDDLLPPGRSPPVRVPVHQTSFDFLLQLVSPGDPS